MAVRLEVFGLLPENLAVASIEADAVSLAGGLIGAGEKYPLAPEYGRGVTDTGQSRLPVEVGGCKGGWNGGRLADAGTVRTAEAGPFLRVSSDLECDQNGKCSD